MNIIKLLTLLFLLTFAAASFSQSKPYQTNIKHQEIDDFLTSLVPHNFNGTVLVSDGKTVFKKGYGFADKENNIKTNTETIYDIGSITKQFTAAGILKLEMMGKLSVTDKITGYFDNVPEDKKDITIHHLLTHSAGFPGAIGDDYEKIDRNDFIRKAFQSKLKTIPGERYAYSNVGYSLLAAIIERTSGISYEEFLNKYLFKPAGMNKTGYTIPKWNKDSIAVGYSDRRRWGKPTEKNWGADAPYWNLLGNGGILSNLDDMYKWHQALENNKILNNSARNKLYTRHIKEGENASSYYGYGWAIFPTTRNTWLIAHNGGNGIFFADFWRFTEEKVTILLLTNSIKEEFERIPFEIAKSVFQTDYKPSIKIEAEKTFSRLENHPKGQIIQHFLKTITDRDPQMISKFVNEHFSEELIRIAPIEKHIEILTQFGTDLKNAKIEKIIQKGDQTILVFKGIDNKLTVNFDNEKIDGLRL